LVLGERACKKGLGKSECLNLRMCELSVAKHALGNRDVIATKECFIACAASGLGTGVERASNRFASGCIEGIPTNGTGHVCFENRIIRIH
jgi:hypothetical protein